jgi:hypothetical protein
VAIGRTARRATREAAVTESFGPKRAAVALDLLELTEFAWHDCYGEITPPDSVIEDMLVVADGDLAHLVTAARLAIEDRRDLSVHAEAIRNAER